MKLTKLPKTRIALKELEQFLITEIATTHVGLDSYALDVCFSSIISATLKYWKTVPRAAIRPYSTNRTFANDYND